MHARATRSLLAVWLCALAACARGVLPEDETGGSSRDASADSVRVDVARADVAPVDVIGVPTDTGSFPDAPASDAPASDTPAADVPAVDAGCRRDAECAADPLRPVCDVARGLCVGCTTSSTCPAGRVCVANECRAGCDDTRPCPAPAACCGGACVDVTSSLANCGRCGSACAVPSGTPACRSGRCEVAACDPGRGDCDGSAATGCEARLDSTEHCGVCGNRCAPGASCSGGTCGCPPGESNCGGVCRPTGAACSAGVGACRRAGTVVCAGTGTACSAVAAPAGTEACPPNGVDDDCDGAVDDVDCGHAVECNVFEDGYANMAGPADAIVSPMVTTACVPAAGGTCRRWWGRCRARAAGDGHEHDVTFAVFDDGYTNMTRQSDAILNTGVGRWCVPGGPSGDCRRWFGRGVTNDVRGHRHTVECYVFDDGYANMAGPSDAIFWNGTQMCIPDGGSGTCRRWFGRCVAR